MQEKTHGMIRENADVKGVDAMTRPIIFLHGSGDTAAIWKPLLEQLAAYPTYAIDLPGHGKRPDTLPATATVEEYTEAVARIIAEEIGIERPIIAGHSLGGAIALMLALTHGEALSGLILCGTGGRLRVHPSLLEAAHENPEACKLQLTRLAVAPQHEEQLVPRLLQESDPGSVRMLYRDLLACDHFDVMSRLAEIRLPTLILTGQEDRLTPPKYAQYMQQQIPDSSLHLLSEAGHYLMREQTAACGQAIEAWL